MWIIKIGGSWITNPKLNILISCLSEASNNNNLIIVAGGGCFSDAVRSVFKKKKMSEKTGHYIALKATEMFSHILREINKDFSLIYNINELKKKSIKLKSGCPQFYSKMNHHF